MTSFQKLVDYQKILQACLFIGQHEIHVKKGGSKDLTILSSVVAVVHVFSFCYVGFSCELLSPDTNL